MKIKTNLITTFVVLLVLFGTILVSMAQDELEEFIIKATATDGGYIKPSGDVYVVGGESQTFDMFSDKGYKLANVLVDDKPMGPENPYTFKDVQSDHTIHAVFEPSGSTFIIKATASDGGKITPSGDVEVAQGSDKTFWIAPKKGYSIKDVLVDGESIGPKEEYTFKDIQSDHTIHADFEVGEFFIIKANASSGGIIKPSGDVRVEPGADQTFWMFPDQDCILVNVFVDGKPVGPVATYTFTKVSSNHTIYADFILPATIDIEPDTLNLKSQGKWITCYIGLPEGYPVEGIADSILLEDRFMVEHSEVQDGILMVKFNRQEVIDYIEDTGFELPTDLTLTVIGKVMINLLYFGGSDTIRVIDQGK
jgi:hypothetical protein